MKQHRGLFAGGLAVLMMVGMTIAWVPGARADPTTSATITLHGVTFPPMFVGLFPCTTETGNVTLTGVNGVFHLNFNKAGDGWFTMTLTGAFSFTPDAPGTVTYSGTVTDWFGNNTNLRNFEATGTLNIHNAIGSDGSTVNAHFIMTIAFTPAEIAAGMPPVVSFSNGVCGA